MGCCKVYFDERVNKWKGHCICYPAMVIQANTANDANIIIQRLACVVDEIIKAEIRRELTHENCR